MSKNDIDNIKNVALNWWNNLPIQDIRGNNGMVNYYYKYFPNEKNRLYGLTVDEIFFIWSNENIIESRKLKIKKLKIK